MSYDFQMKWLITGGTGFIGSHVALAFVEAGHEVLVLDHSDSKAHYKLNEISPSFNGNICDTTTYVEKIEKAKIDGIINLAALKSVEESKRLPKLYYDVNHLGTLRLLETAEKLGIKYFIQSSTAAVYGNNPKGIVSEEDALEPISPYGESKIEAEKALNKFIERDVLRGTSLRYFNVAGTVRRSLKDTSQDNLIPKVLLALSKNEAPIIFGDDYPTKDGTCIRDYVHVEDVARAHLLAAEKLVDKQIAKAINIGTGTGYSVKEVIEALLLDKSSPLVPIIERRREGDPASLTANVDLAKTEISFSASKTLQDMVRSSFL